MFTRRLPIDPMPHFLYAVLMRHHCGYNPRKEPLCSLARLQIDCLLLLFVAYPIISKILTFLEVCSTSEADREAPTNKHTAARSASLS